MFGGHEAFRAKNMMILFESDPPFIRWSVMDGRCLSRGKFIFDRMRLEKVGRKFLKAHAGKNVSFVYLLPNGGEEIDRPVSLLTGGLLAKMERCVKFLPEQNDVIYKTAKHLFAKFPDSRHVLFCDTSFFIGLPKTASTYAIPHNLIKKGIRRYGGYGLCHQQAWEEVRSRFGKGVQRVISVYLGGTPNIAAIKNGAPVETTIGFTAVEGIPSASACGDIDPTIIFQLHAEGMSFERINDLLSEESGLGCIPGKAREVLKYHIVRYVGAFISVLGGVDAVVFTAENIKDSKKLISEICHLLDFLGFKSKMNLRKSGGGTILSKDNSRIKGLCLQYDKCKILNEKAVQLAGKEA